MSETVTYVVPKISGTEVASNEAAIAVLDNSLEYIEGALNSLSGRLDTAGTRYAVIQQGVPISSDVGVGTLVYYNPEAGHARFEPALAKLLALPGEHGESIEAPCARVEGIIISTDASNTFGTLLRGGYYEDPLVIRNCLGADATAGIYYLSTTSAGHATKNTDGLLRQPVLSYYNGPEGKFSLSLFYMAHDNHYHTTAILSGKTINEEVYSGWNPVSSDDEFAPEEFNWVYDGDLLRNAYIGILSPVTTAVFWNGILQPVLDNSGVFAINGGYLYAKMPEPPEVGSVSIFNHFPFAYNSSVVRSIQSTNENMLRVTDTNGVVTLSPYELVGAGSSPSAMAVASITGGTMTYTPVVSGIGGGPGLNVARDITGVVTISLSSMIGEQIDAYSIQHNGTTLITDGVLQFITFPANRTSEFVMFLPVTDVPEGTVLQASAWGTMYGAGAVLNVTGYFIQQPTDGNNTLLPNTSDLTNEEAMSFNGANGELTYKEHVLKGCTVSAPGMLVCRVRKTTVSSSNVQLLRAGFKFSVAQANTAVATTPSGDIGAAVGTAIAATSILIGQPVFINQAGQLAVCNAGNVAHADTCVGIAISGGAAGTEVTYIISGIASSGRNDLIPGTPIYIGMNGTLANITTDSGVETFFDNNAMFLQRVGTAVSKNLMQVNIAPAVIKDEA